MAAPTRDTSTLCLFDVDGTLTPNRKLIEPHIDEFLAKLREKFVIGLVGGSDFVKIAEQMRAQDTLTSKFDYVFSENGLVAFKAETQIGQEDIVKQIGDDKLQKLINFALRYMSELVLPVKRGTFVEFRSSMINLCPVGRSCSQKERDGFAQFDKENKVRLKFVEALKKEFPDSGIEFAIGGQISIDIFPQGWDKTFCLKYVEKDFETIHFFGDKTDKGGNDHEIYEDPRTVGHKVTNPDDTVRQVKELFGL